MADTSVHHSPVEVRDPDGRENWVLHLTEFEPVRLIVFVHGLGGRTVGTWNEFDQSGQMGAWWRESDLLFAGYNSLREPPRESAAWIRRRLAKFYPHLPSEYEACRDARARAPRAAPYRELVLVGHSLGGVVLRLALLQQARKWLCNARECDPAAPRPPLLDATLRIFSPASAGFQPAGLLALLTLPARVRAVLGMVPAFTELCPDKSDLLPRTRDQTESLVASQRGDLAALRAHILWANPEHAVARDGYRTDYEAESLIPTRDHFKCCKPNSNYCEPWQFVETGAHGA